MKNLSKEVTTVLVNRVMNFRTMAHALTMTSILKRILLVKTDVQVISILVIPVGSSLPFLCLLRASAVDTMSSKCK